MTKKILNKLLSVVLVLAICVSTVVGCVITADAADTDATYVINADAVPAYGDKGTATITFDLGTGFTGGSFTLLKNFTTARQEELDSAEEKGQILSLWSYEFIDVELTPVAGTVLDGGDFSADDFTVTNNVFGYVNTDRHETDKLSDVSFTSTKAYTSVTFECTFTWDYHIRLGDQVNGDKTPIDIATSAQTDRYDNAYSDPVLTNGETSYTLTEVDDGVNDYFHTHQFKIVDAWGNYNQKLSADGSDYDIYLGKCSCCGVTQPQVKPSDISSLYQHRYYDISAVNVEYKDDGTISLNIHCTTFNFGNERLVLCYGDGSKSKYGEVSGSTAVLSHYAKIRTDYEDGTYEYSEGALPAGSYMYVIDGISTRDIDSEIYLTRTVTTNGTDYWGNTHSFKLADYCTDVIEGSKVYYPEGTTSEQITADKAVAAALINYGVASANALNNKVVEDEPINVTDTWDGTLATAFSDTSTGTADDPIIINNAEELAYLAKGADGTTAGKYYKVASGSVFDMQGLDGITLNSTLEDVKSATPTGNDWSKTFNNTNAKAFAGVFDGNGLIVYNLYGRSHAMGLFPCVNGSSDGTKVSFKNVTIKNSWFESQSGSYTYGAGAIFGGHLNDNRNGLVIEKCSVFNCNIVTGARANGEARGSGALVGIIPWDSLTVNNCLIADNSLTSDMTVTNTITGGVVAYCRTTSVNNTVVIGSNPIATGTTAFTETYKNVYTDQAATASGITTLALEKMQGAAAKETMSALAWDEVWFVGDEGEYPTFDTIITTDTWDGTVATSLSDTESAGTSDDPIIIYTAEELMYLTTGMGGTTAGKYYKIADGIETFNLNGLTGITLDSTLADVKAATPTGKNWSNNWTNNTNTFAGNFDGNGIIIYNAYGKQWAAGLFPVINGNSAGNTTIKNVTVKNSWFESTAGEYTSGVGAIVGKHHNSVRTGTVIEKCAAINCNIVAGKLNNSTVMGAGTIAGNNAFDTFTINNCLVAESAVTVPSDVTVSGGFMGSGNSSVKVNNSVSVGISPVTTGRTDVTYSNIYTDQTVSQSGVTTIENSLMKGEYAEQNMPNLSWGTVWFTNVAGQYPSFVDDDLVHLPSMVENLLVANGYYSDFIANFYTAYNADVALETNNDKCYFYATSLNLKTNPHMAFTFAFMEEYKQDRANITATFKQGDTVIASVTGDQMINNNTDPENFAGRYHLYRLKELEIMNLCEYITVELSYNGNIIGTGTYSVAGFAHIANDMGAGYEHYANAAQALVFYAEALQTRYALR